MCEARSQRIPKSIGAMRQLPWIAALLVLLGAIAGSVEPNRADGVSGGISGFVYGTSVHGHAPNPLRHATVVVSSWDHSAPTARRVTDDKGFFSFLNVLPGRYYVFAKARGYRGYCPLRVVVIPGSLQNTRMYLATSSKQVDPMCAHQHWSDDGIIF